jgi:dihydroxy-acid dehydratase
LQATGGSTNGLVHLCAVAGRLGIDIDLDRFDAIGRETPVLVDLKPSGSHYMEDLYNAGGLTPVLRELRDDLNLDCLTVTGKTLGENIDDAPQPWPQDVIRSRDNPVNAQGGMVVLHGNLAPDTAIIKQSAADPKLLQHEGRAVVFENMEDMVARIDSDDLDVNADDILVMKNAGPIGAPGMPESGYLPIPRKLARQGLKDIVRISDARMSGTAFGSIILHVSPEAAVGGPLAIVQNGDRILLDTVGRRLELLVDDTEIKRRLESWQAPTPPPGADRGYHKLYREQVNQAPKGVDFEFLRAVD